MTKIDIPFREQFYEKIACSQKIMTTRNKKYGEPGDTFTVPWRGLQIECVLLSVFRIRLFHVAYQFYKPEGCHSVDEFIEIWNKIHPRNKFAETQQRNFWVHVFTPASEWFIL